MATKQKTKSGQVNIAAKHTDESGSPPPKPQDAAAAKQAMEIKVAQETIRANQIASEAAAQGVQLAPPPATADTFPDLAEAFTGKPDPFAPPPGAGQQIANSLVDEIKRGQPAQAPAPQWQQPQPQPAAPVFQAAPPPQPPAFQPVAMDLPVMSPQQLAEQQQYQQPQQASPGYPMVEQQVPPAAQPHHPQGIPASLQPIAPAFQRPGIPAAVNPVQAPHDPNAHVTSSQSQYAWAQPQTPQPPRTREEYNRQQNAPTQAWPDAADVFMGKTNEEVHHGMAYMQERAPARPPVQRIEHVIKHENVDPALAYEVIAPFQGYIGDAFVSYKQGEIISEPYVIDSLLRANCATIVPLHEVQNFIKCPACRHQFPISSGA